MFLLKSSIDPVEDITIIICENNIFTDDFQFDFIFPVELML
jgi:hypothetical protein